MTKQTGNEMVRMENVEKRFGDFVALKGIRLHGHGRRGRRYHRALRLRQIDPAQDHKPT